MSQFNSQQIDAPFRQALIRPARPSRGGGGGGDMPQMGWIGDHSGDYDNDAMRLQNAQNLAVARRQQGQGQSASSERYMTGGPSPIQKAIIASKQAMLQQSLSGNESDEEKSQLGQLANNPDLALNDFQRVLGSRRKPAAQSQQAQHNWGGQQPQEPDQSVNIPKGAFAGQQMQRGDILMNGPAGQTASLGFTEPQQGTGEDSVVNMVNAFKGKVPDEVLSGVQQAINSGMNPQQAFAHLQQAAQQQGAGQQREEAGQQRQQMTQQRQKLAAMTHQQNQLHQDVSKMHSQLQQYGINPDGPESDAQQAGPEALAMYREYHQKGQLYQNLQQQIEGSLQGGGQQEQQAGGMQNTPDNYVMGGQAKTLDHNTAMQFYQQAGGDPNKARQLAKAAGY